MSDFIRGVTLSGGLLLSAIGYSNAWGAQAVAETSQADEGRRRRAAEKLLESKGPAAVPYLKAALGDSSPAVRTTAAEALVALGAVEGRQYLSEVLAKGAIAEQRQAVRVLGANGLGDRAKHVAALVQSLTLRRLPPGSDEKALLGDAVLALARSARLEDSGLILKVAEAEFAEGRPSPLIVEAVGRTSSPESRELLWKLVRRMDGLGDPAAVGIRVTAMLGLTRQGDPAAIESVHAWIRSSGEKGRPEGRLTLVALRSTDAGNFGMDVLDLASQEPEGRHTMEAWEALGRMHTQSLARPALV